MNKKKIIIISAVFIAVVTAIAVSVAFGLIKFNGDEKNQINLNENLVVSDLSSYSGVFTEDGSDEEVSNIAVVKLTNNSDVNYEYVEFIVKTKNESYSFKASSVMANSVTTVLCYDKSELKKNDSICSVELTLCAKYTDEPSLCEDLFELYPMDDTLDDTLNVKNISGKTISKVTVYYKEKDENGYFGGITYRVIFTNFANNDIKQKVSEHFDEVVNITYEQ